MTEGTAASTGNKSIINPKYRDRYKTPDWLGTIIAENCTATHTVETVVKGADGKPTGEKTSKEVKDGIDTVALGKLAEENGIDPSPYANMNAGQQRMNVGNKLRSLTLKRHGLTVGGKWVEADAAWLEEKGAPAEPTHDHDGKAIAKPKPAKAEAAKPVADKIADGTASDTEKAEVAEEAAAAKPKAAAPKKRRGQTG